MAYKIPPQPIGSVPGSGLWNDWIEKLRTAFNDGQVAVTWTNIDFSGSNITDLVSRSHQSLQNLQGGTAGEMYHLDNADYTALSGTRITKGVDTTDDIIIDLATKGLVLKDTQASPHYWRITISNVGALVITDLGTTKP